MWREEGPELVFGDEMLVIRDIGLFEYSVLVLARQDIRDVLLKGKLRRFLALGHVQSLTASSRVRARRTAWWSLRSNSFFGSASVQ